MRSTERRSEFRSRLLAKLVRPMVAGNPSAPRIGLPHIRADFTPTLGCAFCALRAAHPAADDGALRSWSAFPGATLASCRLAG